jgi:hypothetical protein
VGLRACSTPIAEPRRRVAAPPGRLPAPRRPEPSKAASSTSTRSTRGWYEHLEYAPLINARAHQLGKRRRTILNDALAAQYRGFLEWWPTAPRRRDDDLLAAAHYLICLDRVDDALARSPASPREGATARCSTPTSRPTPPAAGRPRGRARIAAAVARPPGRSRWRVRAAALRRCSTRPKGGPSAPGSAAPAVDPDSREQRWPTSPPASPRSSSSPSPASSSCSTTTSPACDAPLLPHGSRAAVLAPAVRAGRRRALQSFIEPGEVIDLSVVFAGAGRTPVAIPPSLAASANLVIEAVAAGLRRAVAHYAHDLAIELAHQYGQIRVLRASDPGAPAGGLRQGLRAPAPAAQCASTRTATPTCAAASTTPPSRPTTSTASSASPSSSSPTRPARPCSRPRRRRALIDPRRQIVASKHVGPRPRFIAVGRGRPVIACPHVSGRCSPPPADRAQPADARQSLDQHDGAGSTPRRRAGRCGS